MSVADNIAQQINRAVADLISTGLSDDQNPAFRRSLGTGNAEVTFPNSRYLVEGMRARDYADIYDALRDSRAYLVRMADGALLQLGYEFNGSGICRHRLAFWPSPYLEEFQNSPEIYIRDEIYAEIVERGVVPFPVRFDFDNRDHAFKEVEHPKCHLTLGQYTRCRIPVTAPVMPAQFFEFVLRNFYNTAHESFSSKLRLGVSWSFEETIAPAEREVLHMHVPQIGAS